MINPSPKLKQTLDKVYNTISIFIEEQGYPPTVRELMKDLDVSSTSTIKYYLDKLEEQNLIRRDSNKNRAIELVKQKNKSKSNVSNIKKNYKVQNVPLIGKVTAGNPILAFEDYDEVYEMSDNIFDAKGEMFMLTVKGDSMIEAGIYSGDRIVVRKQNYANNNDIVVAMISGSATVKRFFKEPNTIRLQPENRLYNPIFSRDVEILGKVVGLVRSL